MFLLRQFLWQLVEPIDGNVEDLLSFVNLTSIPVNDVS